MLAGGGPPPIATGRISSAAGGLRLPQVAFPQQHRAPTGKERMEGTVSARASERGGAGCSGIPLPAHARRHARRGVLRKTGTCTGCRRRVLRDPGTGRALASRRVWALRRPRPCARSAANISTARRARTAAIRDREGHPRGPGEGALAFGSSGRWCRAVSEALSPVYTRVGFSDGSLP